MSSKFLAILLFTLFLPIKQMTAYPDYVFEVDIGHGQDGGNRSVEILRLVGLAKDRIPIVDHRNFEKFTEFIIEYDKKYQNVSELLHRFKVFKKNLQRIKADQKRYPLTRFGITRFSDLTPTEFAGQHGYRPTKSRPFRTQSPQNSFNSTLSLPSYLDWRDHGGVSAVKDQGACGNCYAFATIAAMESQYMLKNKKEISLSEQEITSCTSNENYGNSGCKSGYLSGAIRYLHENGVTTTENYPYISGITGEGEECKALGTPGVVWLKEVWDVEPNVESIARQLYSGGPVTANIDSRPVQGYKGGIIYTAEPPRGWVINHNILIVGYGEEDGVGYWIAKNSWGTREGENGFIRVIRGSNCLGIENEVIAYT